MLLSRTLWSALTQHFLAKDPARGCLQRPLGPGFPSRKRRKRKVLASFAGLGTRAAIAAYINHKHYNYYQIGRLLGGCIAFLLSCATPALASQNVTLAWDPSADPNTVGYDLHYGNGTGNYTQTINVGN